MLGESLGGSSARATAAIHRTVEQRRLLGCQRRLIALLLVSALVALIPAAEANPPDPMYLSGIYDAADLDDVALLVSCLESLPGERRRIAVPPVTTVTAMLSAKRAEPRAGQFR